MHAYGGENSVCFFSPHFKGAYNPGKKQMYEKNKFIRTDNGLWPSLLVTEAGALFGHCTFKGSDEVGAVS